MTGKGLRGCLLICYRIRFGGMGERLKPAVLKTVSVERRSEVRIPLPPRSVPRVCEREIAKELQMLGTTSRILATIPVLVQQIIGDCKR